VKLAAAGDLTVPLAAPSPVHGVGEFVRTCGGRVFGGVQG
jgi:hypothetical protein